eukprot:2068524-Karenia_brevis.AAC.1
MVDGWEEGGWAARLRKLPTMHDIFTALISTREFTHKGLRREYRQEFGRLCVRVLQFNRPDAWDYMQAPVGREIADTMEMKR